MRPVAGLQVPRTLLVEREQEVEEVAGLLLAPDVGLLTLTGPAGVGKTRLALEVARRLEARGGFADGIVFVPLADALDSAAVVPSVARALGLSPPARTAFVRVSAHLAALRMLLVLDNVDHVRDAGPELVELVRACPGVTLLLTSRVVLRVTDERVVPVAPLRTPGADDDADLARLSAVPSVVLFVARACARKPDFRLGPNNARAVSELCRRLEGLPLALELAASQVALLTPEGMLARLADRAGGRATSAMPELTEPLRRALASSYALLSAGARVLLQRLAVFVGGFTLEAAEAIAAGEALERAEVLPALAELLDASMVAEDLQERGSRRWRLPETVGDFAAHALAAAPAAEARLEDAHAAHFLGWLAGLASDVRGPRQHEVLAAVEADLGNVIRAWRYGASRPEPDWRALDGASEALWMLVAVRGRHAEGTELFGLAADAIRKLPGPGPTVARARLLLGWGASLFRTGALARAREVLEESVRVLRAHDRPGEVAFGLNMLAAALHLSGDLRQERALLRESVRLARAAGDRWLCAYSLNDLGLVEHLLGARREAERLVEEAIAIHSEFDDRRGMAFDLHNLALYAAEAGDLDAAEALHARSRDLRRQLSDRWGVASSQLELGAVARRKGGSGRAKALLLDAMLWAEQASATPIAIEALAELARLRFDEGSAAAARVLAAPVLRHPEMHIRPWGAAAGLAERVGGGGWVQVLAVTPGSLAAELERVAVEADAAEPGRATPDRLDAVVRLVAVTAAPAATPPPEPARGTTFTPRETDIVKLVARGAGNRDIAAELGISVRTVERHVSTLYEKLGLRGGGARAALTAYAFRHGLLA